MTTNQPFNPLSPSPPLFSPRVLLPVSPSRPSLSRTAVLEIWAAAASLPHPACPTRRRRKRDLRARRRGLTNRSARQRREGRGGARRRGPRGRPARRRRERLHGRPARRRRGSGSASALCSIRRRTGSNRRRGEHRTLPVFLLLRRASPCTRGMSTTIIILVLTALACSFG
jgi:hypothetical protein